MSPSIDRRQWKWHSPRERLPSDDITRNDSADYYPTFCGGACTLLSLRSAEKILEGNVDLFNSGEYSITHFNLIATICFEKLFWVKLEVAGKANPGTFRKEDVLFTGIIRAKVHLSTPKYIYGICTHYQDESKDDKALRIRKWLRKSCWKSCFFEYLDEFYHMDTPKKWYFHAF